MNSAMPVIAASVVVLPMLWLVFWIEAQSAERLEQIACIARYAVMALIFLSTASVILTFTLSRDPLCMHIPKGYESWPCGVAQHMYWPADDAPHQGLLRTEVRPFVTFF